MSDESVRPVLISVVIPAYQAEKTIARCAYSVLECSDPRLELIIVNDGSSDRTLSICKMIERCDKRVSVINQRNLGRSAARNAGLALASGDWVTFADADDWFHPGSVHGLFGYLDLDADCIVFKVSSERYSARGKYEIDCEEVRACLLNPASVHACEATRKRLRGFWLGPVYAKLYRREAIVGHAFELGLRFGEDALFNYEVFNAVKILFVDEGVYCFNRAVPGTVGAFSVGDVAHVSSYIDTVRRLFAVDGDEAKDVRSFIGGEVLRLCLRAARYGDGGKEACEAVSALVEDALVRKCLMDVEFPSFKERIHMLPLRVLLAKGKAHEALSLEKGWQNTKMVLSRALKRGRDETKISSEDFLNDDKKG